MWRAVATGHVRHADAVRVHAGLRHGFTAGVDVARLAGHRWFKNYKSALEGRGAVTRAVMKRVQTDKTVYLGEWMPQLAEALRKIYRAMLPSTSWRPATAGCCGGFIFRRYLLFLFGGIFGLLLRELLSLSWVVLSSHCTELYLGLLLG